MTRQTLLLASVAIAALGQGGAYAAPNDFYFGIEGGLNLVDDIRAFRSHTGVVSGTSNVQMNFDSGWAFIATVGHVFDQGFRLEGEAGFRSNKFAIPTSSRQGDFDEVTLMLNGAWDFNVTSRMRLTVGAGIGGDYAMFNDGVIDDSDWRLAYQGLAGLRYGLSPHVDLALTYRYLRVDGPSYSGAHGAHIDSYDLDDLSKQTVSLGFVFNLGPDDAPPAAPPPEAPPPMTPPPQDFVIYFNKKCNLTAEANAILTEAGAAAKEQGRSTVRLMSAGASADAATNECRFHAAKANLVGKGVPEGAVTQSGPAELRIDWK